MGRDFPSVPISPKGGIAFLFPGQGSQYAGMGKDLVREFPEAREIFRQAAEALDFDLAQVCFQGPEERLMLTEFAQPAILTVSLAAGAVLRSRGLEPDYVAGHSLGEYSALIHAGGLPTADGVRLVRRRGQLMGRAMTAGAGAMAAVIGLAAGEVEQVCRDSGGTVEVANYNCPGQVVISGLKADVEKAGELAKQRGARRAVALAVSGAFHSSLMRSAAEEFGGCLEAAGIRDPKVPLVANVDARPHRRASEILALLKRQVAAAVRWEDSMRFLIDRGVRFAVEVGPQNVLAGLMKRIDPGVKVLAADGPGDFAAIERLMASGELNRE